MTTNNLNNLIVPYSDAGASDIIEQRTNPQPLQPQSLKGIKYLTPKKSPLVDSDLMDTAPKAVNVLANQQNDASANQTSTSIESIWNVSKNEKSQMIFKNTQK